MASLAPLDRLFAIRSCIAAASESLPASSVLSNFLNPSQLTSAKRLRYIVQDFFEGGEIAREVERTLSSPGHAERCRAWNAYWRASDHVLGFCDEYLEMIYSAHVALKPCNKIVDFHSASGNFSIALLQLDHNRDVTAIHPVPGALTYLDQKFTRLGAFSRSPSLRLLSFPVQDQGSLSQALQGFDGGLSYQLLSTLPPEQRASFLTLVHESLPLGGRLVLLEPMAAVLRNNDRIRDLMMRVLSSALANRSPMTELDVGVWIAGTLKAMKRNAWGAWNAEALRAHLDFLGFKIQSQRSVFFGSTLEIDVEKVCEKQG